MKRRGVSLLELVVAISLLYLVVTFVLQLLPTNLYFMIRSQSRLVADNLAGSELQTQVHRPFSDLTIGLSQNLPEVTLNSKVYTSQLEVLAAASEDKNHLRLVRITVSWQDRGATRNLVRETWIHASSSGS